MSCQDGVRNVDALKEVLSGCDMFPDVKAGSDGLCILPEGGESDLCNLTLNLTAHDWQN